MHEHHFKNINYLNVGIYIYICNRPMGILLGLTQRPLLSPHLLPGFTAWYFFQNNEDGEPRDLNLRNELSNGKNPGCLGGIGDEILPNYMGIIISHYKDPYKRNETHGNTHTKGPWVVATQVCLIFTPIRGRWTHFESYFSDALKHTHTHTNTYRIHGTGIQLTFLLVYKCRYNIPVPWPG